jgi:predicted ATPase
MDITLKNLGPIQEANFTVGDLTVVCGRNNTGKTYITYATYGFLYDWNNRDYWKFDKTDGIDINLIQTLLKEKQITLSLDVFMEEVTAIFSKSWISSTNTNSWKNNKPEGSHTQADFNIKKALSKIGKLQSLLINDTGTAKKLFFSIAFNKKTETVTLSIDIFGEISQEDVAFHISSYIKNSVFGRIIPNVLIASVERTGAALFQREVDFTRSRLIDLIKETNINPQQLLGRFTAEYPLPVKHNIDFIRDLPNIVNKKSIFAQEHPEVLQTFDDIAGGEYTINRAGGISYSPSNQPDLNLSLAESSSTVRSLVEIGFYLRHLSKKGDLLMVDEPELNLHPENQRKIARLFAMLVNHGIRVFITTHSDYIIKEFNTLLLLNKSDERLQALAQREGYQPTELLKPEQLNVYMTTVDERVTDKISYTLIPAKITNDSGIELTSFNDTIEDMNRLQDEIVWG